MAVEEGSSWQRSAPQGLQEAGFGLPEKAGSMCGYGGCRYWRPSRSTPTKPYSRRRDCGALVNTMALTCPPATVTFTSHDARYCPVTTFGPGRPEAFFWMRTRRSMA
ncbi:hypothetical protein GCM10009601_41500 [Streptomyces thermospinosisporus]|uniref:Uncharacterized protein n=1 Tax=Streptomyces thermospinosisporus TaxID=161482 RepID=A0ABN1Z237_9ACTN